MNLDKKLAAIALHYFDTHDHVLKCLKKTSSQIGDTFENVTNVIFAQIPSNIAKIYDYASDYDSKMDKVFFGLLRKQDSPNLILAAMRIFARNQTNMKTLSQLYDLYFEMFGADPSASYIGWRVITIGIAERHVMYGKNVIYDEKSEVISTFERNSHYFVKNEKEWVYDFFPPPSPSGYSFMETILITHFGFLICRDLFSPSILEIYAKDKRIKKILNTRKEPDTLIMLTVIASTAIGIYSKDPLVYIDVLKKYKLPHTSETPKSIADSYTELNISLIK